MVSTKFMFLVSLCFIGLQVSNAATIKTCTAAADCAATQKCIPLTGGTVCVEICTSDADCGGVTCATATTPDTDGKTDFNTCLLVGLGCSSDADCTTDPAAPVCNPFMLGCAANTATATTILATTVGSTSTTTAKSVTTVPACADKVVGGSNDCIAMAPYCTNSVYLSLMKDKCPKTCGYCTTSSGSSGSGSTSNGCIDLIVGGSNDCVSMASYCTNTVYKTLMKEKCPKTCGYCSSTSSSSSSSGSTNISTCKDNASDCSTKSYLCKNSIYLSLMKSTCPLTCGYC